MTSGCLGEDGLNREAAEGTQDWGYCSFQSRIFKGRTRGRAGPLGLSPLLASGRQRREGVSRTDQQVAALPLG